MSTANKNYPLIKETDSNGQPLNAYDQLVTEGNNFRRAVDTDINEVENKVGSLEQKVITESGSNSNGRYIKFGDGTQICYITSLLIPHASVSALRGGWNFPASFNSENVTTLAGFDELEVDRRGKMTIFTRNATTTTVQVLAATRSDEALFTSSSTQRVKLIAIGRWK